MTAILRVRAQWSGFTGGPGYTVLHFRDFGTGEGPGADPTAEQAAQAHARVQAFFTSIKSVLPNVVKINVDKTVDLLEDTTGTLIDAFSLTGGPEIVGGAASTYSAASGGVINWRTGSVRNGRRIRGRSFIVPMANTSWGNDGQMVTLARTTLQDAATALVDTTSTPDLGVYARPSSPASTDGQWVVATSASVPTLAAVLRSRRD